MSATPGSLEVCQDCEFKDTVCPETCWIYQDLKGEFEYEMEMEMEEGING